VVIGPLAGAWLSPLQAACVAVVGSSCNCLYTAVLLPESLSPAAMRMVWFSTSDRFCDSAGFALPWQCIALTCSHLLQGS
jgi:hypothetical protein